MQNPGPEQRPTSRRHIHLLPEQRYENSAGFVSLVCDAASQAVTVVRNPTCSAGDVRDPGSIPASGRSPEEEMAAHSSVLAWRIPGTEEPGGLQSLGSQRVRDGGSDLARIGSMRTL